MSLKNLYQDLILDHGQNPRNFKLLDNYNREIISQNPLCGDRIHLFAIIDKNKMLDMSFKGNGCAITLASSSIMTQILKKEMIVDAKKLIDYFINKFKDPNLKFPLKRDKNIELKINSFDSVRKFPMRIKCAILPWVAAKSLISNDTNEINIENLKI